MNAEQPIAPYNGNPQKENGYTPIANELLEAILLYPFTLRQQSIVLALCRMTYGYSKKSDALSGWQIAKMIGIDRSHVSKALDELIKLNVIIKHPVGRYSHGIVVYEISLNKHYETWITVAKSAPLPKQPPLPNHGITVADSASLPLPKQPTHKAIKTTKAIYVEILEYLNLKANKKFKPVKANLDLIKARLTEYSEQDLKAVIDSRVTKWINDPKMNEYLRPSTLFNATKCAQYISEGPAKAEVPAWKKGLI
jgi:phage replication O-like protein O